MTARSGSESRKRSKLIGVRFTPEEYAAVERQAAAKGVRPTVLVRELALANRAAYPDPEGES